MHAYLIVGDHQGNEVNQLIKKLRSKRLDFEISKIKEVRELRQFTHLALSEKTAIVLNGFDQASEAAQNAFLKELEEPQKNLIYILTAQSADLLLPTIVSRCLVIENPIMGQVSKKYLAPAKKFLKASVGEKLQITSRITNRQEAIEFVQTFLIVGHDVLLQEPQTALSLEGALETLKGLQANGNVQLQLTNLVVNSKNGSL